MLKEVSVQLADVCIGDVQVAVATQGHTCTISSIVCSAVDLAASTPPFTSRHAVQHGAKAHLSDPVWRQEVQHCSHAVLQTASHGRAQVFDVATKQPIVCRLLPQDVPDHDAQE